MAQKVQVILLDDLDGGDADESLSFGLDGVDYEIDLSTTNATALREAFGEWVANARRVGGRSKVQNINTRRPRTQPDTDVTAIRNWARENGYQVSDRGRVSADITEAYKNRNKIVIPEATVASVEDEPQQEKPRPRRRASKIAASS